MADPGRTTDIAKALIDQVAGLVRQTSDGTWMGPGVPPLPVAQDTQGRVMDYRPGRNVNYAPRAEEQVSFETLRGLADGCNLLRIILETRKDQVEKIPWRVKLIRDREDDGKRIEVDDATKARIAEVESLFRFPDGQHSQQTWMRMLMEDLLVIDAPCVEPRRSLGGQVIGFDPIDGATINRVLDKDGRTPEPPMPAYVQRLLGMPANWLTTDDLAYVPRNVRTNRVYGYSPVEQIILTVNIAIRRDLSRLDYYTQGTIPDALIKAPESWTPDQIAKFEKYFTSLMEGNSAERRKVKFIPGGDVVFSKDFILKDEADEWFARVIAYAFSLPPTALVQLANRSISDNIREQALEEGLVPLLQYLKSFLDRLIQLYMGHADLEWSWLDEKDVDLKTKSEIDSIRMKDGVKSLDDVRIESGQEPVNVGPLIHTAFGIFTPEQIAGGYIPGTAPEADGAFDSVETEEPNDAPDDAGLSPPEEGRAEKKRPGGLRGGATRPSAPTRPSS